MLIIISANNTFKYERLKQDTSHGKLTRIKRRWMATACAVPKADGPSAGPFFAFARVLSALSVRFFLQTGLRGLPWPPPPSFCIPVRAVLLCFSFHERPPEASNAALVLGPGPDRFESTTYYALQNAISFPGGAISRASRATLSTRVSLANCAPRAPTVAFLSLFISSFFFFHLFTSPFLLSNLLLSNECLSKVDWRMRTRVT